MGTTNTDDAPPPDCFLALTNDAPDRRNGLTLHFVNATDEPVALRAHADGIIDMPSGPFQIGRATREPAWKVFGIVAPRSAVPIAEQLSPSSDVIVYWTLELTVGREVTELTIIEYRDHPVNVAPLHLEVLDRKGWGFWPERSRRHGHSSA